MKDLFSNIAEAIRCLTIIGGRMSNFIFGFIIGILFYQISLTAYEERAHNEFKNWLKFELRFNDRMKDCIAVDDRADSVSKCMKALGY